MRVRRRLVCQIAENLLASHPQATKQTGAVDPRAIAKAHGIEIREAPYEESLSGFLIHDSSGLVFIGVNSLDGEKRQRFTIAHELGHYFLHDRSQPFLDDLTGRFKVMPRNEVSREGSDIREMEANLFAAELLMPEQRIRRDLERIGHLDLLDEKDSVISQMALKYEVSVRAFTIRLERLGFFNHI